MIELNEFLDQFLRYETILTIDDSPDFQAICERMENEGWAAWTANYGRTIFDYAQSARERGYRYLSASEKNPFRVTGVRQIDAQIVNAAEIICEENKMGEEALALLF